MIQQMLPSAMVTAEELGGHKEQGEQGKRIWSQIVEVQERNEFSEPRGLPLPIHRMLNSLA